MRKCNTWRNSLIAGTLGGYGKRIQASLEERDKIAEMKSLGQTVTDMAMALGRKMFNNSSSPERQGLLPITNTS
jgi:hypothetical protein